MQGFAAISANNGWAMALTGASIVILGLAALAFIISQLHRFIALFENKETPSASPEPTESVQRVVVPAVSTDILLSDLETTAKIYQPLTETLNPAFTLAELYRLMESQDLPHPHLTVRELRAAGYLRPVGDGTFTWKTESSSTVC